MKKMTALFMLLALLLAGCGNGNAPTESTAVPESTAAEETPVLLEQLELNEGAYTIEVTLNGGSGRATVQSPAVLEIENGQAFLTLVWSSSNYDYMIVNGQRYDFITVEGGSTFRIPVDGFNYHMPVTADTVAMSTPHEVDYTLYLDCATVTAG